MSFSEELASIKLEEEMEASAVPTPCMPQTELQATDADQPVPAIVLPVDAVAVR